MKNNLPIYGFATRMMSPEIMEAIFIQRQKFVAYLIESIKESTFTQNKHYDLLVGMRGIGKTFTTALIFHRLRKTEDLENKLVIAWLQEEEYVSSFLDLLLKIFRVLKQNYTEEYKTKLDSQVEDLYRLSADNALQKAEKILKEFINKRTLLLMIENLDEIFKSLGDIGQKQFRAYIQNNNFITILATSQSLFDGVKSREYPFYGFFNPHSLEKLTKEEAQSLLLKIAQLEDNPELETFIKSPKGRDRIAALHHLAGGNHRVYIIFSQFLTRDSLDELTPYYQAKMQWLSPQQRKIVEFLCDRRNAIPVKEIAQRCFITHQTASSQLKDLREKGYVTAESIGRASYYELQEPLMGIWFEFKKQRGKPIKLLVDFLRIWYTKDELWNRYFSLPEEENIERQYIKKALNVSLTDEEIKRKFYLGIKKHISNITLEDLNRILKDGKSQDVDDTAWFEIGNILHDLAKYEEALKAFDMAIRINPNNPDIWRHKAETLFELKRDQENLYVHDKLLEFNSQDAKTWTNQGVLFGNIGEYEKESKAYNKAIQLDPKDINALRNKGICLYKLEKYQEAIKVFDKVINLNPKDTISWSNKGRTLIEIGRYDEALEYCGYIIEIDRNNIEAWFKQLTIQYEYKKYDDALISCENIIQMQPHSSDVWLFKGAILYETEKYKQSLDSLNKVIGIDSSLAVAYLGRIEPIFKLNRWEEGFKDLADALNRFANTEEPETGDTTEFIKILWESTTDITVWKSRLKTLLEIYNRYQVASVLSKGIVDNIPNLMSEMVSNKATRSWLEIWQEIAGDKPELAIALRFLKTAIDYKETKGDRKVLLQLAKEERELLEPLLEKS